jgi:hypothetical protein
MKPHFKFANRVGVRKHFLSIARLISLIILTVKSNNFNLKIQKKQEY